jgi:hypothetical protein
MNKNRRLIPLIIEDCNPPDILAQFAYIDWRIPSNKEYQRLLASCQKKNFNPHLINSNSEIQRLNSKYLQNSKQRIPMPYFSNLQIAPPSNWQDFESLCCDLWREIWKDPNTKKNGRQGQPQNGVDIFGTYNGKLCGVQCKCKNNDLNKNLTESEVEEEVQKAKNFVPKLSEFIIATTGPKDAKVEEFARKITDDHLKNGLFSVHISGWNDIKERLDDFPNVRDKHYWQTSTFSNEIKETGNEINFKREKLREINEKLIDPLLKCVIPGSFENDIAVLIENPYRKEQFITDNRKREFLFKLYAAAIIGNSFNGHPWATELRKPKSEEILDIIKKDPYSNEVLIRINSLKNETILDLKELSDELISLYGEWQNNYHL